MASFSTTSTDALSPRAREQNSATCLSSLQVEAPSTAAAFQTPTCPELPMATGRVRYVWSKNPPSMTPAILGYAHPQRHLGVKCGTTPAPAGDMRVSGRPQDTRGWNITPMPTPVGVIAIPTPSTCYHRRCPSYHSHGVHHRGARSSRRAAGAPKGKARFFTSLAVIAWTLFLYLHFSRLSGTPQISRGNGAGGDPCRGRYIYIYKLPPRFHADIVRDCGKTTDTQWPDTCASLSNAGLGPPLAADDLFTGEPAGWHDTHQFALDVIFHNRMKQYKCLTNRTTTATVLFVPFYAGLDFARYRSGYDGATRDAASTDLMVWLTGQPQWGRRMWGHDHFLVAGRTGFDFLRRSGGNGLLAMPAARNLSVLMLESTLDHGSDYSVPYPTYFHPRSDADVLRWQDTARRHRRTRLMAFVGAPPLDTRVRDLVVAQCKASSACALLGSHITPANTMRLFQKASFCLQPPSTGDTWTRRSVFDAMVAGCIPVFFHAASAYKQYRWHLPKDHLSYSVYIPDEDVRRRNVSIEAVLRSIPAATVERMREEVIKLIPRVVYADPRSRLETIKDAFDVAIEGILDTVARIKNGENVDSGRPASEDPPNLYASTESVLSKSAWKGGGARWRRAVGAKWLEKAAESVLPPLRWLVILAVIAWALFIYVQFSMLSAAEEVEVSDGGDDTTDSADPCHGRYIYVHDDLPPRFNADILRDCNKTEDHWPDMCGHVSNAGLGRPLADDGDLTGEAGWYGTHQFALDAIFHNRMKQYECLTNDSDVANAVFVPFYAGFDFARYHWGYDNATRDAASLDLSEWLMARPQWQRMGGRDHFLVAGRTGWDFGRTNNVDSGWGNDLLAMPAGRNMSVLVLESTFKHTHDYSVLYPTYFHPKSDADVLQWQTRVRGQRRPWLMAFVGAPRPDMRRELRVRDHVIAQCNASRACAMLGCANAPGSPQCHAPGDIMRHFQKVSFCLQPPGDSWTRRSVFDAMVAGCIPVFFHPGTAYKQYRWHLPKDYLSYSVYIPDEDIRWWNVSIEDVLRSIPADVVEKMREEVIKLIPRILYADPRSRLETIKDAVDIAVEGVLTTVARIKKGEWVDSGRPVNEDPPNMYVSTESRFRPRSVLSKSAAKGAGARWRRVVGAKGLENAAASALPPLQLLAILAVIAWTLFLYVQFSVLSAGVEVEVSHGGDDTDSADPCRGRYVYVHDLPPRFNADIIRDCDKTGDHWGDMCGYVSNSGLGRPLADDADGVLTGEAGWYGTHQFGLDAIFHNRMKQYECLTNQSAVASAVFIPFYAGFDFTRYHWGYDNAVRDAASQDLAEWLMARPQWRRMWGRDHFLVAGRTGWDFKRSSNVDSNWGNDLLGLPAGRNMSVLVLESTFLHGMDFSVPYPTYFHPRSDADVLRWQARVRAQRRPWLMAFVGAPRPEADARKYIRVRDLVIAQCEKAPGACAMLGCKRAPGSPQCHAPGDIVRLFQTASFCLQPPGDSSTRRSVFDAMVAGCIPVFFHTASAYKQYRWHLPKDHLNYSVYIPEEDVRRRNVSIEAVLRSIPPDVVEKMREEVIKLIPRILYADPRSRMETIKDAVDIAVEGVLDAVARIKRGEWVDSGRPVSEDPPNLYVSTESRFRPKSARDACGDFVNLEDLPAQSFGGAHRGRNSVLPSLPGSNAGSRAPRDLINAPRLLLQPMCRPRDPELRASVTGIRRPRITHCRVAGSVVTPSSSSVEGSDDSQSSPAFDPRATHLRAFPFLTMEKAGKRWVPHLLLLGAMSWLLMVYFHVAVFRTPPVVSAPLVAAAASDGVRFLHRQEEQLRKIGTSATSVIGALPASGETRRPRRASDEAACNGRYVYIHDLPRRFNADILGNCAHWYPWHNMCGYLENGGLGEPVENTEGVFGDEGWYATDHFGLDIIFHRRVEQYDCLTDDSSLAAAFFVPFYAGFDIVQHLWGVNSTAREKDALSLDLVDWLTRRPEWRAMGGRDHFFLSGRTAYDHQRRPESESEWGSKLLHLPAVQNMTVLFVEKLPWTSFDFAIPYPTYFHPANDAQIIEWQERMRAMKRKWLFSFAGGARNDPYSIRLHLIRQCGSSSFCNLVQCRKNERNCLIPSTFMRVFQGTRFCLQPTGDTMTRRSAFDAIMAGCVPVFFHRDSAYTQYRWHLPEEHDAYSVFIDEADVRAGNVSIEETLRRIPPEVAERMTETVIGLIPRLVYADPRSRLETLRDAVDVTLEAVIARVNKMREEMGGGGGARQS
nr:unnamed protein product [Digitaria exilis]